MFTSGSIFMPKFVTPMPIPVLRPMLRPVLLVLIIGSLSWADDFPQPVNTEPLSEENWLSPVDAAAAMKMPEGFRAVPFAAEPDVQNPIAMAWDGRGRLWIAENYTYAERKQKFQLDLRDRVVIQLHATSTVRDNH